MKVYNCANLLYVNDNTILLVKVRNNEKYYLPGGKIEAGENGVQALVREINEELKVILKPQDCKFICTVKSVAYPDDENQVLLNCYYANMSKYCLIENNEITDIKMIPLKDKHLMAPAVIKLVNKIEEGVVNV